MSPAVVFILILGVIALSLAISFVVAFSLFGPRTVKRFPAVNVGPPLKLTWEECTKCTAGTQWWDGTGWTTIPEHVRVVRDQRTPGEDQRYFEAKQMNVRKCPHCQLGGWWRDTGKQE